ncbi:unnamed protein product [Chilo suppressalis]|uniref:DUF4781 domain-containing protein n=1 Tax=Chilo suppressalis TaxID=168631 RepID=A0ABN8AQN4_CHISP|nr:unnamed protein product [Chilo suppressalis]
MAAMVEPPVNERKVSAVEMQQEYYEAVGDVDWELYEKKDRKYLLQKVAVALCGLPTKEGNLATNDNDLKLQGYELREEEAIDRVFSKICEQAKYSQDNESIFISIIRVVCVSPKKIVPFYEITPSDYWVDLHEKKSDVVDLIPFHVFSLRKCIPTKSGEEGCRVFIDHDGRVYQNWEAYLSENNLPQCVMVLPENGQYRGSFDLDIDNVTDLYELEIMPLVKCSVVPSPALGIGAKVLSVADTVSTVANIGALVGMAGGLLIPAAAPIVLGTAVGVGVASGVYGIVRSSINLADRSKHEQSIGFETAESRASWINIIVSATGISVSGATKLLSWAASSGTNVTILMNAVRVLQYANLGTGFLGVANSLADMIVNYTKYNQTPTTLEIFQFTTSALFFGIGAMSNQTAQEIVQDAQAKTINEIRDSLPSNVKKKMFDKVNAETRRVQGTVKGNADVIKALQKIENKNDFFAKIARINKQMNKNKLRISLAPDGNPLINNQHKIGIQELHGLGKSGRDQLFSKYGPAKINSKNAPTRIYASSSSNNTFGFSKESQCFIRPEEIIKISNFLLSLCRADQDVIFEILSEITSNAHDAFLLFCAELIACLVPFEIELLFSLDHDYKVRIVLYVFNYIKSKINMNDSDADISFVRIIKKFFRDGKVDVDTIKKVKEKLMERLYERMSSTDNEKTKYDKYDDLFNFRKSRNVRFMTLEADEIVTIGKHNIFVKASTTENLDLWLDMFPQEVCDVFLNLCFKVISLLTTDEINKLIEINFDEDIILRVSYYLIFETDGEVFDVIREDYYTELFIDVASNYKEELIKWRSRQSVQKYVECKTCSGVRFSEL